MKAILKYFTLIFLILMLTGCSGDSSGGQSGDSVGDEAAVHTHTPAEPVMENEVPVGCLTDGSYDSVVYCSACTEELTRESVTVDSIGHTPSEPVMENEIPAGCLTDGSYDNVVYCSVCFYELTRESVTVDSIGHTPAEPTMENIIQPICKTDGSCDKVVKCSACQTELSRTADRVPALGHEWVNDECKNCGVAFSVEESLELALSDDRTYYIITGIGSFYGTELIMPSEYNGLPVKEIGDYAFENCTFVTRAVVPASITRLGYGAAQGCTGLEELILEDRKGWSLYDGQEDPKIFPIPAFLLINTSNYFDLLIDGDQFALVKD